MIPPYAGPEGATSVAAPVPVRLLLNELEFAVEANLLFRRSVYLSAMRAARSTVTVLVLMSAAAGLTTAAQSPITFEVTSVKPNVSGDLRQSTGMKGRTFSAVNVPLRLLILAAYDLASEPFRLVGAPSWIATDRFDVVASTPEGAKPADRRAMLQALLEDRFRLVVRKESREMRIDALVRARTDGRLGQQLKPSSPVDCEAVAAARAAARGKGAPPPPPPAPDDIPPCTTFVDSGQLRGRARPLPVLATLLQEIVERHVVDRTGLDGNFDFDVKFVRENAAAGDAATAIYTALREQLGLRLEATSGPVEVLVIDSIERPTPD
jgi:uncharacterized protein (TIGR03435 family)